MRILFWLEDTNHTDPDYSDIWNIRKARNFGKDFRLRETFADNISFY